MKDTSGQFKFSNKFLACAKDMHFIAEGREKSCLEWVGLVWFISFIAHLIFKSTILDQSEEVNRFLVKKKVV